MESVQVVEPRTLDSLYFVPSGQAVSTVVQPAWYAGAPRWTANTATLFEYFIRSAPLALLIVPY